MSDCIKQSKKEILVDNTSRKDLYPYTFTSKVLDDEGNHLDDVLENLDKSVKMTDIVAKNAARESEVAVNSIASLKGLANSTTAMETLAGQVTQIEDNKQRIEGLESRLVVISESEYENLENIELDKIYFIYKD